MIKILKSSMNLSLLILYLWQLKMLQEVLCGDKNECSNWQCMQWNFSRRRRVPKSFETFRWHHSVKARKHITLDFVITFLLCAKLQYPDIWKVLTSLSKLKLLKKILLYYSKGAGMQAGNLLNMTNTLISHRNTCKIFNTLAPIEKNILGPMNSVYLWIFISLKKTCWFLISYLRAPSSSLGQWRGNWCLSIVSVSSKLILQKSGWVVKGTSACVSLSV